MSSSFFKYIKFVLSIVHFSLVFISIFSVCVSLWYTTLLIWLNCISYVPPNHLTIQWSRNRFLKKCFCFLDKHIFICNVKSCYNFAVRSFQIRNSNLNTYLLALKTNTVNLYNNNQLVIHFLKTRLFIDFKYSSNFEICIYPVIAILLRMLVKPFIWDHLD